MPNTTLTSQTACVPMSTTLDFEHDGHICGSSAPPGFIISLNDIQLPDTSGHRHSTPSNSGSELQTPEDSDYDGDVSPGSNEEDDDAFPNGKPLCGSHVGLSDGIPLLGKVEDPPVNET